MGNNGYLYRGMESMTGNLHLLQQMTEKQLLIYNAEFAAKRKNVFVAYLLWAFFGLVGLHKVYLNQGLGGAFYLCMFLGGWFTLAAPWMMVCWFILGFFIMFDLFTIPAQTKTSEEKEGEKIARNLLSAGSPISN